MIDALENKKIYAAGLDVFNNEPNLDKRYLNLDNCFVLPHVGSATHETRLAMRMMAVDNLCCFLYKNRLISEVEMLAWEILGLPPPDSLKRKSGKLNQLLMGTGPRTRAAALTRSAIFPGLGQIYLGEDQLGYAYITSSLVITLFAMRAHNAYKNAYDDVDLYYPKYRDTKDPAVAKEYRILSKQAEKLEVDAANEYGLSMIFTGMRLFRH